MSAKTLAVDLGTATVLVWAKGQGIVLSEPTVVAVDQPSGDVLAMGNEAYELIAASAGSLVVQRPLHGGAITDFQTTVRLARLLLGRLGASRFSRPQVLMCVPSDTTDVERRAVEEALMRAGAAACHLMEEPLAAAIGAGLPVEEPIGCMVVDLGGGTCEVAMVSLGGVVVSRSVRTGGLDLDRAIAEHVRLAHGVQIGERAAEELKITVGSAFPSPEPRSAEVRGRDLSSGTPRAVVVRDDEVREALEPQVAGVVKAVLGALSESPPELLEDVLRGGIHLVGGGALLHGIDARLAHETAVDVRVVEHPREAVVTGAGRTVDEHDDLRRLFASR